MITLENLKSGERCIIVKVHGYGEFRHRVMELGFVSGQLVTVIKNAPMKDPVEYQIMDSRITLRRSEAKMIEVMLLSDDIRYNSEYSFEGTHLGAKSTIEAQKHIPKSIDIALVGNPNAGKTTIFNRLSGSNEKTGNYAGVTVGEKIVTIQHGEYTINLIDLPGTYSMTEYSKEEVFVREYLTNHHPDIVLNIVDCTNLERNLFLTTQLIDMSSDIVMALNMYDELLESGSKLDYKHLSQMLGFPIIPTIANKGERLTELLDTAIMLFEERAEVRHFHINYGKLIEGEITNIERELDLNSDIRAMYHTRYLAIKLIETPKFIDTIDLKGADNLDFSPKRLTDAIDRAHLKLEKEYKDEPRAVVTAARYGFIRGALAETLQKKVNRRLQMTSEIDNVLTNKFFGIPLLLGFMWLVFQATFTLGSFPAGWLESLVGLISDGVSSLIPQGMLHDIVIDGIIGGVGSVIVFVPNILILFLFMAFMEESGYLARAAFIMDRFMHKIGLHGKSFIPLLMGFGCNVPAIVSTRVLASRKDRLITMLIIPFMSCSARLPVFILLISIFFTNNQGTILLSLYAIGILFAIISSLILNKSIKVKEEAPFVMELPPYRLPSSNAVMRQAWEKVVHYLRKMGTTIMAFSILVWVLGYFPRHEGQNLTPSQQLEQSYIGMIGSAIEPAIRPLGFDWKMGVSLASALGAKEVAVSTMGVLYSGSDGAESNEEDATLKENIRNDRYTSGKKQGELVYSPVIAYSFMVFMLLYVPCVAVIAAVAREGSKKWALIMVAMTIGAAWIGSYLTTTIGNWLF